MKIAARLGSSPVRYSVFSDPELTAQPRFRHFPTLLTAINFSTPRPRHPKWPEMERDQVAQHDDLAVLGALGQGCRQQVGRRHQAVDVLVMLVEDHTVEAKLVSVGQLVEIFLIQTTRLVRVEQFVGNGDPAAFVFLLVTLVEIGPWHEVPGKNVGAIGRGGVDGGIH